MTTAAAAPDGVNDPQTERILEALLFASREPLSETVLASHLPEYTDIHARAGRARRALCGQRR